MPYWYSLETGKSQYKSPEPQPVFTNLFFALCALALFLALGAWRIWWLWTYEPTLLFPTKTPKKKVQKWRRSKMKQRKGKMNQDGKGGRSANTSHG
jgi:hypothetical protein